MQKDQYNDDDDHHHHLSAAVSLRNKKERQKKCQMKEHHKGITLNSYKLYSSNLEVTNAKNVFFSIISFFYLVCFIFVVFLFSIFLHSFVYRRKNYYYYFILFPGCFYQATDMIRLADPCFREAINICPSSIIRAATAAAAAEVAF